jgi:hypothetical protein
MILEALNYAATLAVTPKEFRPYIRYSVNLWSRAHRCSREWAEHEKNGRNSILAAAAKLKQRRTAVVLGSGLLRDVPVRELVRLFDTVVLVDLVHVASMRMVQAYKGSKTLRMISRDLSGYEDLAAGRLPEPLGFLRQVPYLDFVVSANLLSQIGTGMKKRLDSERPGKMPDDAVPQLIKAHLDGLTGLPCKTYLLTDISYQVHDRTGKTLETFDLLHGVSPPKALNSWAWPVVPFGEESRDYQVVHQVIASELT